MEVFKGCKNLKTLTANFKKRNIIGKNALESIRPKTNIKIPAGSEISFYPFIG